MYTLQVLGSTKESHQGLFPLDNNLSRSKYFLSILHYPVTDGLYRTACFGSAILLAFTSQKMLMLRALLVDWQFVISMPPTIYKYFWKSLEGLPPTSVQGASRTISSSLDSTKTINAPSAWLFQDYTDFTGIARVKLP